MHSALSSLLTNTAWHELDWFNKSNVSSTCILAASSLSNSVDVLDTSNVSCWDVTWRDNWNLGFTLNLEKCSFAQREVKFCVQLIGSGFRQADPTKVAALEEMKIPETKTEVRKMLGFFSWFRDYIPNYATHAKPLTDLTTKRVPEKIPWDQTKQAEFEKLRAVM